MSTDYTLTELQAGIDSDNIEWSDSCNLPASRGDKNGLPNRFEFPALCRMADIIKRTMPSRPVMRSLYPNGFIVKMETSYYSTLQIIAK